MQSTDEFTPSTTEPVFGSGLLSQNKNQSSTNNDVNDNDKVNVPVAEPIVNGQTDSTVNKASSNENITNGTSETVSATAHVNGENNKAITDVNADVKPAEESTASVAEPMATEPPLVVDTAKEGSSSVPTTSMDTTPASAVEPTAVTNDKGVGVPVASESEATEPKSKSTRGRAKAAAAATPVAPTRQSTRGRQTASSSTNVEANALADEKVATTTVQPEAPKRSKRQAPAETTTVSPAQPTSTSDVPVVDAEVTEETTKIASPIASKKRGSAAASAGAKKAQGKTSNTSVSDVDSGAGTSESESVPTPSKKARTSATKKTPEPPSEEYARKLRPRK